MIEEINENKTVLHQKPDGSYERILLKDAEDNPIIHEEIDEKDIKRITKIYKSLLGITIDFDVLNLEEFEIMFMREYDIAEAIKRWRIISRIFRKYIREHGIFSRKEATTIVELTFLYIMKYDFSEEDKKDIMLQRIIDYYEKLD